MKFLILFVFIYLSFSSTCSELCETKRTHRKGHERNPQPVFNQKTLSLEFLLQKIKMLELKKLATQNCQGQDQQEEITESDLLTF